LQQLGNTEAKKIEEFHQPLNYEEDITSEVLTSKENDLISGRRKDIPVYNVVSGTENPCTLQEWNDNIINAYNDFPLDRMYCTPSVALVSNKNAHQIMDFFFHNVPACFIDLARMVVGKKPRLLKLAQKMKVNLEVLQFFICRSWIWKTNNVSKLRSEMSNQDQKEFDFNSSAINWPAYVKVYARGTKKFLLKEDFSGYPAARRHLQRLRMIGYGLQLMAFMVVWRLLVPRTLIAKNLWHLFLSFWFKFIKFFQLSSTIHRTSFISRLMAK